MNHKLSNHNQFSVVHLLEDIDSSNSGDFDKIIESSISSGAKALILDFSAVKFIDSSGISSIAKNYRILNEKECKVTLAGCNEALKKIFQLIGFHKFFKITATLQEALDQKA